MMQTTAQAPISGTGQTASRYGGYQGWKSQSLVPILRDGAYVYGLSLEGARWDMQGAMLAPSAAGEMTCACQLLTVKQHLQIKQNRTFTNVPATSICGGADVRLFGAVEDEGAVRKMGVSGDGADHGRRVQVRWPGLACCARLGLAWRSYEAGWMRFFCSYAGHSAIARLSTDAGRQTGGAVRSALGAPATGKGALALGARHRRPHIGARPARHRVLAGIY